MRSMRFPLIVLLAGLFLSNQAFAQYFGQNKPRYTNFDFKVVQSPHFEVYHYLQDRSELTKVMQWAELWYKMHEHVLQDTFNQKNPLVLYNNHADFQQTSTVSGGIGVSTGGVTEGLKNRVVMPLAMSNQQTFQVLGHEMVHAFQFHMLLSGDSTGLQSLSNLPLWIVEGLAEYMSIGNVDAHTAMWMRNAVYSEDVPSLKELSINPRYFPYRYGQAFWSFLTGLYGDEVIKPFFIATAKFGIENSTRLVLGISLEDLSEMWRKSLINYYEPLFKGKKEHPEGQTFLSEENSGQLNIAPAVSPNGRYVVYLSEKSIFSTDLYLADVRTGKIIRKVYSQNKSGNVDHLHYLESAGTWSPNSKEFAYVVFSKGRNRLVITDALSGKVVDEFPLKNVPSFSNPTWSPDGRSIIVNGLVDGQPDLFEINLRSHNTQQLTNDDFAEIQPSYSYDGKRIAFVTDRVSMTEGRTDGAWKYNLATLDLETKEITNLDVFLGANNMNPVWDENNNIYFLSDRDGFRNIYQYQLDSNRIIQLTDIITGVSGITKYTPAISVSKDGNNLLYTHYVGKSYNVQKARPDKMDRTVVDPHDVDFTAAILPPGKTDGKDIVNNALENIDKKETIGSGDLKNQKYKPKFKLDYLGGGGGVGVGTSNTFGTRTGLVGGIDMVFSDVLGYNQIYSSLALNGEIYDFGGQVLYMNTRNKIGYGASLAHIPYRFSYVDPSDYFGRLEQVETNQGNITAVNYPYTTVRYFIDAISGLTQYAFSRTMRVEANIGFTHYGLRADEYNRYFAAIPDGGGGYFAGPYLGEDRERIETAPGFGLYSAGVAWVGDNSSFGLTSPLQGYRYRVGIDQFTGDYNYRTLLIDARKYFWFDKFNISVRGLHYGRYGSDADARPLGSIYVIDPTLVRGYNNVSVADLDTFGLSIADIQGSKIAVANAEIRLPFTGPERLSLIKSGFLLSDLVAFFDVGMAWQNIGEGRTFDPKPIMSTGVSLRVNLFGAFIIEPYLAKPLQSSSGWAFGLNFVPGW